MTVTTSSFETSDLDEARHLMSVAYAENRLHISAGRRAALRIAHRRHDCGPVRLDSYAGTPTLDYRVELPDYVVFTRIISGTLDFDDGRAAFRAGPGDLVAVGPGREHRAIASRTKMSVAGVDVALLAEVGGDSLTGIERRMRSQLIDPARARAWQVTMTYAADTVCHLGREPHSGLLVDSTNRLVAAAMLTTLLPGSNAVSADRIAACPQTVRRAIAFIESHPDAPISVVDIARAAYVTPRALQLAFRRHVGTTPMAYLRRVRLDHGRADLLAAEPSDGQTVTAIAVRWGFTASSFAEQYRAAYGELPSQTLRSWPRVGQPAVETAT